MQVVKDNNLEGVLGIKFKGNSKKKQPKDQPSDLNQKGDEEE